MREKFDGLYDFRKTLLAWAEDATLSPKGRELAVTSIEQIDAGVAAINNGLYAPSEFEAVDLPKLGIAYHREIHLWANISHRWTRFLADENHPSTIIKPYTPSPVDRSPKVAPSTAPEVDVFQFGEQP